MTRERIQKEIDSIDRRIQNKKTARDSSTDDVYKRKVNDEIKSLEEDRKTFASRLRKLGGEIGGKMVNGVRVFTKRKRI